MSRRSLRPLEPHTQPEVLDDLELLVSELVTNSVRHADLVEGDVIELSVEITEDRIRIRVLDPGRGFSQRDVAGEKDRSSGWGLLMVDRIADRWGTESHPGDGSSVWCEIDGRRAARRFERAR